jgi:hypothetical protein
MALKVDKSKVSDKAWGEVDKAALGKALADAFAAGNVTKAQIREVYAFVPDEAFTNAEGKPVFFPSKAWGPHHELIGDSIVLNRGGLGGAAGAIAGSRSAPSLSAGDLAKAKAHLRKHYKAIKEDVPAGMKESLAVRRVERGKALDETKGSLGYTMQIVEDAFRKQFNPADVYPFPYYILYGEIFPDHVIVGEREGHLAPDEFYLVTYQVTGNSEFIFASFDQWEIVELAYQPQTTAAVGEGRSESLPNSKRGRRLEERQNSSVQLLESSADGKTRHIRVNGLMTAGVINGNSRRYPQPILEAAVAEWQKHLHESAGQGRLKTLTGESDHPADKGKKRAEYLETVVNWTAVAMDGPSLNVEGALILTSKGRDVETLMEAGVFPGGSVRGYYESKPLKEGEQKFEEVTWCNITGADLVGDPSFDNRADLLESQQPQEDTMDPEAIRKFIGEHPDLFKDLIKGEVTEAVKVLSADQLKALEETVRKTLGIGAEADWAKALTEAVAAKKELDESKRQAAITLAISEATKTLPYGEKLNTAFVAAVKATQPATPEAVKPLVEAKRVEYDAIVAAAKLQAMGYLGVQVAPVLEQETGTPEFARGAFEFHESLVRSGDVVRHNLVKPKTINEIQATKVLDRFDLLFKLQLMRESRQMQEQEVATDLNLPYSVSRAILQSVWPELIATSIFDTSVTDQAPSRVYYETYAGESGSSASPTDEDFTPVLNTWVSLAHKMIQPGTLTVVSHTPGTTYVEGTDYVADYFNGAIKALTGGLPIALTHANYTYDAVRQGENQAIQRGKVTLAYTTLEIAANRLADQITNEAIVFARSQIGWDATTRTLASLVNQLRRRIDKTLMYNALSAALSVASNSGGTWTAASDPIINFISYIGVAKVKVAKRFYTPTFVLASATNSDRVANWDGFTAAGQRPDSDLNANGYLGRLKGLPVFQSTEFSDGYALVGNKELLMYRVFQPMTLKGPFPSYSSGNLVAADQWYAEQYDGALCPVNEKGSTVKVV